MNTQIIKAMNRKNEKHPIRDWWKKNGYKIVRVVLFPVWGYVVASDKITDWLNARQKWSEERANEILNYYIPRCANWTEEEKTFYFFDNGCGWYIGSAKRYLKRKDRRFWDLFHHKIRWHLMDNFELEGFKKELGDCSSGWTEISFEMIEKGD
jgi:hypothetical protein